VLCNAKLGKFHVDAEEAMLRTSGRRDVRPGELADGGKPRLSLKMGRLRRETCVDAAKFNFLRRKLGEGAFSARET